MVSETAPNTSIAAAIFGRWAGREEKCWLEHF
jgi:hypothetical protein